MRCARTAALVCALGALAAGSGPALALQAVHVTALAIRTDRARVQLGEPFHLFVHAHVRERVARLDGVILPDLTGFNTIADERAYTAGATGTDYTETLTLVPLRPGRAGIGPVTFDVFDTAARRALRYSSNTAWIIVGAAAAFDPLAAGRDLLAGILRALAVLATIAAALAVLAILFVRRKRAVPATPAPLPVVPETQAPAYAVDPLGEALDRLRRTRDRSGAREVRALLLVRAGAPAGATLAHALSRNGALDSRLRAALIAAERAAFVEPARLQTAIDELLERGERLR